MKKKIITLPLVIILLGLSISCSDFMDIVPDNVATTDQAFRMRSTAERFLFSCYSYLPSHGSLTQNPGLTGGDEVWLPPTRTSITAWQIARNNQRLVDPYTNYWEGTQNAKDLYEGIRQVNIFLKNISSVPDIKEEEKDRWVAEGKFLKAYFHFWLARMYGPIVIVKQNLPVFEEREKVNVPRSSVDEVFNYVVKLLDEASKDLPDQIDNEITELGRITKPIALSVKAKVLVTAASPLFNGNNDYVGLTDSDGENLFNTEFSTSKWDSAAVASKEAIDLVESLGYKLYNFENSQFSGNQLSDTTKVKMSIRNSVTKKWNSEIIWGNTNSMANSIQAYATPRGLDPAKLGNYGVRGMIAPTLKIAQMFYTDHGVPIQEDKTWPFNQRFDVKIAGESNRYNLKEGYPTAVLHFNREPRFYASLGFDGGVWYGQGNFEDDDGNLLFVSNKNGDPASEVNPANYSTTGYFAKKLVNYNNVIVKNTNTYTVEPYPWPVIRLADLYLLYAEALNEAEGPSPEVYKYINLVRARAGIPPVEEAWKNYSTNPNKYATKSGLREIIHQERSIELALEGKRFWDLRRWKKASEELNKSITGWDLDQEVPEAYYRERVIFEQNFTTKDYLWPLSEDIILSNTNINQNPGW